jgi:hypothetical protein
MSVFVVAATFGVASPLFGQDPKGGNAAQPPRVEERPGPDPIPEVKLLPDLPTIPIQRGVSKFNVTMVDASLLPRDKEGIWVLDFAFKPLRLLTIDEAGKGRRPVHYLYYRVINHTGQPRQFVPQFTLVTDSGKRYEEAVIPKAVNMIKAREDYLVSLLGAVDIAGVIPPSTKEGVDDAVFGVAIWDAVDPKADRMTIYVRGLSDGYKEITDDSGKPPVVKYKTLCIDLIRRGDHIHINEKEIQLLDPPYRWEYWAP